MKAIRRNRVEITLPTDTQILITREFDVPKEFVYEAWTNPELIKRWWGGDRGVVTSAEVDLRVGGKWRYVMTANAGFEVAFHGEYREIIPNERIVLTEVFEPMPDAAALSTLSLEENNGGTIFRLLVEHQSQEYRDAQMNSGMEDGLQESMDHLADVASSLRGGSATTTTFT